MSVSIYSARSMTGRVQKDVVEESQQDRLTFEEHGIKVFCPVQAEHIKPANKKLLSTKEQMDIYWFRDKKMIRHADVFVDCTPHLKSQGVEREAGYARYFLFKPIVRIFPADKLPAPGNICFYEDDLIVTDIDDAAKQIKDLWGTPRKRLQWKLSLVKRCILNYLKVRLVWLVEWI